MIRRRTEKYQRANQKLLLEEEQKNTKGLIRSYD
jgi:hypothetical protein